MGIIYNKYDILKQENVDESVKLKRDNRLMIERITDYISSKKVSLFELEIIKKDLIGIAGEAESEGISLQKKLGVSEREFAESISLVTEGESMYEHTLLFFRRMMMELSAVYILFFLMSGAPKTYGLTLDIIFYGIFIVFLRDYLEKIVERRFMYSDKKKKVSRYISVLEIVLILVWFEIPMNRLFLISGNGWIIGIILLVILLVVHMSNNRYWNNQAKKYNWE